MILINLSSSAFTVENGARVAQMVVTKHERADWQLVEVLDETTRGEAGFGSTGIK